jgi:hypothetical protein
MKIKIKEEKSENLYEVVHQILATDTLEYSSTLVRAGSKAEALEIFLVYFNEIHKKHYKYLKDPTIEDIYTAKVIVKI